MADRRSEWQKQAAEVGDAEASAWDRYWAWRAEGREAAEHSGGLTEVTEAYEPGDVLGQVSGLRGPLLGRLADEVIIIDDPVKFPDAGDRYQWPDRSSWALADAPLWAKIIGYSFVAVLAIVGGLALGILILFLVAVLQALVDVVVH